MSIDKSERFLSVLQSNKGIIYKVSNAYCKKVEDRKDLIQEITLQLWRSFDRYDPQYKHSTWIYRIALNVAISFYRKETLRADNSAPLSEELFRLDENSSKQSDPNLALLQKFIAELKELDRALMLLYLEEKSYKEIAEILGITETNVATKIARIKSALKQKFSTTKN